MDLSQRVAVNEAEINHIKTELVKIEALTEDINKSVQFIKDDMGLMKRNYTAYLYALSGIMGVDLVLHNTALCNKILTVLKIVSG